MEGRSRVSDCCLSYLQQILCIRSVVSDPRELMGCYFTYLNRADYEFYMWVPLIVTCLIYLFVYFRGFFLLVSSLIFSVGFVHYWMWIWTAGELPIVNKIRVIYLANNMVNCGNCLSNGYKFYKVPEGLHTDGGLMKITLCCLWSQRVMESFYSISWQWPCQVSLTYDSQNLHYDKKAECTPIAGSEVFL